MSGEQEAATTATETVQPTNERRWPGVLLSLLVPGFGLVRAGLPLRGLFSFVGIQLAGVAVALLIIARSVPAWAVCIGILVWFICFVVMLADSFRPGRLSWPLAAIFVVVVVAQLVLPGLPLLIGSVYRVPTVSMEPTFIGTTNGTPDHLIVDRISYLLSKPQRGDLVVFRTTGIPGIPGAGDKTLLLERLVGLPGEQIEIRDGRVFANGRALDHRDGIPGIKYAAPLFKASFETSSYTVPEDSFFFLGDNSEKSHDSRYWGSVPRRNIVGRVSRIYYPWSRIGVPR